MVFTNLAERLPLLTEAGRAFLGLQHSSAPELNRRVEALFAHLDTRLGFEDTDAGRQSQDVFNLIVRYAYPEIMIDLADLIYVQHERPMVFLNLDHIHRNWQADPTPAHPVSEMESLTRKMDALFRELADWLKQDRGLGEDATVVRLLAESYSYYLYLTKNFPWEDPLKDSVSPGLRSVLDAATGLAGYSIIHDWPPTHPNLVLSDDMPFIIEGLTHYKNLLGKSNVEILKASFPESSVSSARFGVVQASKFLHHLQREERKAFLKWVWEHLEPGGVIAIVDTDLENNILKDAEDASYRNKLMPGYLETLVPIEDRFCHNLVDDLRELGFAVHEFDFHEYHDQTDAYSHFPGDDLPIKFLGFEIVAERPSD